MAYEVQLQNRLDVVGGVLVTCKTAVLAVGALRVATLLLVALLALWVALWVTLWVNVLVRVALLIACLLVTLLACLVVALHVRGPDR